MLKKREKNITRKILNVASVARSLNDKKMERLGRLLETFASKEFDYKADFSNALHTYIGNRSAGVDELTRVSELMMQSDLPRKIRNAGATLYKEVTGIELRDGLGEGQHP